MHLGRCKCESVRYQFMGKPLTCYACHCSDCQTSTGSAFAMVMLIKSKDMTVIEGEPDTKVVVYSGKQVQEFHCKQCGTELWATSKEYPDFTALKPGTFDETSWVKPIAHVWVSDAQPWVHLDIATEKYNKQPDMSILIDLWAKSESE